MRLVNWHHWLKRAGNNVRRRSRRESKRPRSYLPRLESLEGRIVPAWISQGPAPTINAQVIVPPDDRVTGAIESIVTDASNADVVYIGAVNGGIWKTTNATAANPAWTVLTDALPSQSIGALQFDPTDATRQTLVAATGHFSSLAQLGDDLVGLYYTTDGGANWTQLNNANLLGQSFTSVSARGAVLMAGSDSAGLFRSTNGGTSWSNISGTNGLGAGPIFDLAADPGNLNRFYAGVQGVGIFTSNDGGATWTNVTTGITGMGPTNDNIEISVHNSGGTDVVYVGVANNGAASGLFRSTNQGAAWTALDTPQINPGGQAFLHFSVAAHPTNPNLVFLGGDRITGPPFTGNVVRVDASQAAGSQITSIVDGNAGNTAPHADSRHLIFDANGNLLESDDGGIYRRSNPTSSSGTWGSVIGNLQVSEAHSVAYNVISHSSMIGTQDNGTHQQPANGGTVWDWFNGGDGGDVAVDNLTLAASNQAIRYFSSQNLGGFRRQVVSNTNTVISTTFINTAVVTDPDFVTPIALNAINPQRLLISGTQNLYESLNQGGTITSLGAIGPTGFLQNALVYGGISSGTPNPDLIYIGRGSQVLTRATAGGPITPTSPLGAGATTVADVTINPSDWRSVFAIDNNQVFMSTNAGASWTDVTGNLLSISSAFFRTIAYVPSTAGGDGIVVGTRSGTFFARLSAISSWSKLSTGMPDALVFDMDYNQADDVLVASTLGRGVWMLPNASDFGAGGGVDIQLSATFTDATIRVDPNNPNQLQVLNGTTLFATYPLPVTGIRVNGFPGNDSVTLNFSFGNFMPPAGFDYNGGAGVDSLIITGNTLNNWTLTSANTGEANGNARFRNVENLSGPGGANSYTFTAGASIAGAIDGGTQGTVDAAATTVAANVVLTTPGTTTGFNGTAGPVIGAFQSISNFAGPNAANTLTGPNTANTWLITGPDAGIFNNGAFNFSRIPSLVGGTLADSFRLFGGTLSGSITGNGGADTLTGGFAPATWTITGTDSGAVTGIAGGFSGIGVLVGGTQSDNFVLAGGTLTGSIAGGGGSDSLTGDNVPSTFTVTGFNAGTVTGVGGGFSGIRRLVGGSAADTFQLAGGTLSNSIVGGGGADTLIGGNVVNLWTITGLNSGELTGVVGNFFDIPNLVGGTAADTFRLSTGTLTGTITGGGGTDLLIGADVANTWTITAVDGGTVTGVAGGFTGIGGLVGGSAADSFRLAGGTLSGSISGGGGANTLTGGNANTTWTIIALDTGTVTGVTGGFVSIGNLAGGNGNDSFQLAGGTLSGALSGGGGNDTLVAANVANTWTITTANGGTVTGLAGGFTGIENLTSGNKNDSFTIAGGTLTGTITGGGGTDSLTGGNVSNTWSINAANAGAVTGIGGFTGIANLIGGAQSDNFTIAGGSLTGSIAGGGGSDTITGGNVSTPATWSITAANAGTVTGIAGGFSGITNLVGAPINDTFQLAGGSLTGSIAGGGGNDTLIGGSAGSTWVVSAANAGTLNGIGGGFSAIANLQGGAGVDSFTLAGGTLTGSIFGGGGADTLTGGNVNNAWSITLPNSGTVTGIGGIFSGIANLVGGTANDSFTLAGGSLSGSLTGGGGTDSLTGGNGANSWTITGPGAGAVTGINSFSAITNLVGGAANDTFQLAGGSIAGSIAGGGGSDTLIGGNVANTWTITTTNAGAVNGVAGGFTAIANLRGGTVGDNFTLAGGAPAGTITGGSGSASVLVNFTQGVPAVPVTFAGGTATNSLTLQGGTFTNETATPAGLNSGSLTFDGFAVNFSNLNALNDSSAATNYTVNGTAQIDNFFIVNGPAVSGNQTTQINGGGAFLPLNIYNKTNLTVNGQGGADTFTLNNPNAGVGLSTVTLQGGAANASFTVTPSAAIPYKVTGGTSSAPINTLTVNLAGTTNPKLTTQFNPVTGYTGDWTFGNRQPVAFSNIATLIPTALLELTLTGPPSAIEGSTITYTIGIHNTGPSDAANVVLSAPIPANAAFVSSSFPSYNSSTGLANLGTIVNNATVTGTIVLQALDHGSVTEVVNVNATTADPRPATPEQSVKTPVLDAPITATGITFTPTEGNPFNGIVATFTDANPLGVPSDFTANINWGDGHSKSGIVTFGATGGFVVIGSNTYAEKGTYPVQVKIDDKGGSTSSAQSTAKVLDAQVTALAQAITGTEGVPISAVVAIFTDGNPNAVANQFTATINWGDGASSVGAIATRVAGGFSVSGGHTYIKPGVFSVEVSIVDRGVLAATTVGPATIADPPMVARAVSFQATVNRTINAIVATFTDASTVDTASDFSATISWGDGTTSPGVITGGNGNYTVSGTHIYAFSGSYATRITILERDGAFDSAVVFGTATVTGIPHGNQSIIAVGADAGGGPNVNVYDGFTRSLKFSYFAYDPKFTGGARVAVGDVNNDGTPDVITGPGPGGGPNVRVVDGSTGQQLPGPIGNFMAFNAAFSGGIFVAAGDVNSDGFADIIVGADAGGGPNVAVFSGLDGSTLVNFFPYDPAFTGGVRVGAGDVNGDGFTDVVTGAGLGGGSNVLVFSGANGAVLHNFTAFPTFFGGIYVAAGDTNGDGRADLIVGKGKGSSPDVSVFSGVTGGQLSIFSAYNPAFSGGVRVAGVIVARDGPAQILTGAGPGGGPEVDIFSSPTAAQLDRFFAFDPLFTSGVFTAAGS